MSCRNLFRTLLLLPLLADCVPMWSAVVAAAKNSAKPRVVVLGVNGAEMDIILPLLIRGEMPNLGRVIDRGVFGKLRTLSAPNCPKIYSALETSALPQENGITGFLVDGKPASTDLLKRQPLWTTLSNAGVSVGMANVPATFPVKPVNGYMISGMLTRGVNCEDGLLCSPLLSQVSGGDAVYPKSLAGEIAGRVGELPLDCARMPGASQVTGHEPSVVHDWLARVDYIRGQQQKLFDYLLTEHSTDFTFFVQSCEDRVGHWLYPIQPHNVGYNSKVHTLRLEAFPEQYRALDRVLGTILRHIDANTTLIVLSDHGIKPLREHTPSFAHRDHGGTTPIIANHDFQDGDDVPGVFIAMGPHIRKGARILGLDMSVLDVAPTILHLYGLPLTDGSRGRILTEIFEGQALQRR